MSSKPSIREMRAICHGSGVQTSGMERAELEAAAEAVRARGTFFRDDEEATEEAVEESLDRVAVAEEEDAAEEEASASEDAEAFTDKKAFLVPSNTNSPLLVSGWIEQYRKSKFRYVWKEVLVSLVEGRNPGEVTTLWIQREKSDPETGLKELEALHRIPLPVVEDVSFTEQTKDNQFRVKVYNGVEDYVFRCGNAPNDALRWVLKIRELRAISLEGDLVSDDEENKAEDNVNNDDEEFKKEDIDDLDAEDEGIDTEREENEEVVASEEAELENPIAPALDIEQDTSGATVMNGSETEEGDAFRSEENPPNDEAFADLLEEELRNVLRSENEKLRKELSSTKATLVDKERERETLSSELDATKTTLAEVKSKLVASKAAKKSLSNQLASYEATKTALAEVGHEQGGDRATSTTDKKKASRVAFWAIGVALLAIVISISNGFLAHPIVKQVLDHPIVVEVLDHAIVKDGTTKLSDAKHAVLEHPSVNQISTSFHGWAFGRNEKVKDETNKLSDAKSAAVERRSLKQAAKSLYGWAFGRHEEGAGKE